MAVTIQFSFLAGLFWNNMKKRQICVISDLTVSCLLLITVCVLNCNCKCILLNSTQSEKKCGTIICQKIMKFSAQQGTIMNNFYLLALTRWLNPLKPELNPICYLLALLPHDFLHVSRIRAKSLTLWLLMSYIYGAPILDVSRSHTTTQHSR
jgi:hypothetical protein